MECPPALSRGEWSYSTRSRVPSSRLHPLLRGTAPAREMGNPRGLIRITGTVPAFRHTGICPPTPKSGNTLPVDPENIPTLNHTTVL